MKKLLAAALGAALLISMPTLAPAKEKAHAKKPDTVTGKVTLVEAIGDVKRITIDHGEKAPKVFTVTDATKITVNHVHGKPLGDVRVDMEARITFEAGTTIATEIEAKDKEKHKKRK